MRASLDAPELRQAMVEGPVRDNLQDEQKLRAERASLGEADRAGYVITVFEKL